MSVEGIYHKPHCPAKIVSPTFPWKTTLKSSGSLVVASTVGGIAITIIFFTTPSILGSMGAFALIGPAVSGGVSTLVLIVVGSVKTACKRRCFTNPDTLDDSAPDPTVSTTPVVTSDKSVSSASATFHTAAEGTDSEAADDYFPLDLAPALKSIAATLVALHAEHVLKSDAEEFDVIAQTPLDRAIATLCSVDWNWDGVGLHDLAAVKQWLAGFSQGTRFSDINGNDLEAKERCYQEFVSAWSGVIALIRFGFSKMQDGKAILDLDAQIEARLLEDTKKMNWIAKQALNNRASLAARKGVVKTAVTSVLADPQAAAYARDSAKRLFVDGEYDSHTSVDIGDLTTLSYQRIMDDIIYDSKEIRYLFQMINMMAPQDQIQNCQDALLDLIEELYPVYYSLALSNTPDFYCALAAQFGQIPDSLDTMDPSDISLSWFKSLLVKAMSGDYAAHDSEEEFSD